MTGWPHDPGASRWFDAAPPPRKGLDGACFPYARGSARSASEKRMYDRVPMSPLAKPGGVLALLAAAVVVACSSFSASAPADATDAGPRPADDAGPSATDGGGADASPDVCTGTFCTGFDEVSPLAGWVDASKNGGVAVVDSTGSTSPPSALHAKTGTGSPAAYNPAAAAIRKNFSGVHRGLRCAFSLRVDTRGAADKFAQVLALVVSDFGGAYVQLLVNVYGNGSLELATQSTTSQSHLFQSPANELASSDWRRVGLDVDFGGLAPSATLRLDGATLATPGFASPIASGAVSAVLGLNYVERGDNEWQLHIDDVDCATRD